jgi:hypothetical protein
MRDKPILSSLYKDYDRKGSVEKKISGRGPQRGLAVNRQRKVTLTLNEFAVGQSPVEREHGSGGHCWDPSPSNDLRKHSRLRRLST